MNDDLPPCNDFGDSRFLREIVVSNWPYILSGALVGLVLAIGIAVSQPKRWPAVALAKIGQVGGVPLTTPASVLKRTKFPSFVDDALHAADMEVDANDASAKLARKTFITYAQPDTTLFQMQVAGYSPEEATRFLNGAMAVLQRDNQAQLEIAIKEKKEQLASLDNSITSNRKERQTILASIDGSARKTEVQAPDPLMISQLVRANQDERARLVEQRAILKDQLQEAKTHNTRLETPIFVAQKPLGPSRIVAALVGALLASTLMVALFAVKAWIAPKRN